MSGPTPRLRLRGLRVASREALLVEVDEMVVQPGERVALLGASGSGKSLTASSVLGSLPPSLAVQGSLELDGRQVPWGTRPQGRAGLAAVFQDSRSALNPMVAAGAQISDAARRAGLPRSAARAHCLELLGSLAFEDPERIAASAPGRLSGGQRQRACIALALATRARLLVADEPTTALDTISQAEVVQALAQHTGGGGDAPSLLFITHDIAVASQLCSRALVMHRGRIVEQAPMDQLVHNPQHPYTQLLVEAARAETAALAGERTQAA